MEETVRKVMLVNSVIIRLNNYTILIVTKLNTARALLTNVFMEHFVHSHMEIKKLISQ